jgi:ABC-type Fe3+/spermidine/putrescine transport system ATPase subunit
VKAVIDSVHYQGSVTRLLTRSGKQQITVAAPSSGVSKGDTLLLAWSKSDMHLMEQEA